MGMPSQENRKTAWIFVGKFKESGSKVLGVCIPRLHSPRSACQPFSSGSLLSTGAAQACKSSEVRATTPAFIDFSSDIPESIRVSRSHQTKCARTNRQPEFSNASEPELRRSFDPLRGAHDQDRPGPDSISASQQSGLGHESHRLCHHGMPVLL